MMEGCNLENDLVSVMKLVDETHNRGKGSFIVVVVSVDISMQILLKLFSTYMIMTRKLAV